MRDLHWIVIEDLFKCIDIVLGVPHSDFEEILEEEKLANNLILDTDLSPSNMKTLVKDTKNTLKNN